jgi:hypothetical protein
MSDLMENRYPVVDNEKELYEQVSRIRAVGMLLCTADYACIPGSGEEYFEQLLKRAAKRSKSKDFGNKGYWQPIFTVIKGTYDRYKDVEEEDYKEAEKLIVDNYIMSQKRLKAVVKKALKEAYNVAVIIEMEVIRPGGNPGGSELYGVVTLRRV